MPSLKGSAPADPGAEEGLGGQERLDRGPHHALHQQAIGAVRELQHLDDAQHGPRPVDVVRAGALSELLDRRANPRLQRFVAGNHAEHGVGMADQILGARLHGDVDAVGERLEVEEGAPGVVHDGPHAGRQCVVNTEFRQLTIDNASWQSHLSRTAIGRPIGDTETGLGIQSVANVTEENQIRCL